MVSGINPVQLSNFLTVGVSAAVAFTTNHSQSLFARWTSVVLNLAQPHYVLYEGVLNPRPPSYIHRTPWKSGDVRVRTSRGKINSDKMKLPRN